jgi:hypothetical protein
MTTTTSNAPAPAAGAPAPAAPAAAPAAPNAAAELLGGAPAPAPAPGAPAAAPAPAPGTDPNAAGDAALKLPGKDATPEQWAEFYKAIGAPEKAEDYKLPVPEGDDGAFARTASEWFKDAGILPQQAEKLAGAWNEFVASQQQAADEAKADRVAALHAKNTAEQADLRNEWGQQHAANMEFARRAATQFFPKEQAGAVIEAMEGVLGYKATIQALHRIGQGLGEHDATAGLGGAGNAGEGEKSLAQRMYPNMPN